MNRAPIYAGLFAYFAGLSSGGAPLFKTVTRIPRHWEEVAGEDQPALLMRKRSEKAEYRKFLPIKWVLDIDLLIYVQAASEPDADPGQLLEPLLDAVDTALEVDDVVNNVCTLGGLVSYATFDGTTQIHLGTLDGEAVAVVPIRVLVNA